MKRSLSILLLFTLTSCNSMFTDNSSNEELSSTIEETSNNNNTDLEYCKNIIEDIINNYHTYYSSKIELELHTKIPSLITTLPHKAETKTLMRFDSDQRLYYRNISRYIDYIWHQGTEEEYHYLDDEYYYKFDVYYKTCTKTNNPNYYFNYTEEVNSFMDIVINPYNKLKHIFNLLLDKLDNRSDSLDEYNISSNGSGHILVESKSTMFIKLIEFKNYLPIRASLCEAKFVNDYPHEVYETYSYNYDFNMSVPSFAEYQIVEL